MGNKNLILRVLSVLGFITSAAFTYKLNAGMADSNTELVLSALMTITMQSGSFYFFHKAVYDKGGKVAFYGLLALLLFTLSIVATISFQIGRENKISNESVVNSQQFKNVQENREIAKNNRSRLDSSIEGAKENVDEVRAFYNGELAKIEKEKDVLFATKKANKVAWRDEGIEKNIDKVSIRQQALITKRKKAMDSATSTYNSLLNKSGGSSTLQTELKEGEILILDEKGNLGLSARISEFTGWKKTTISLAIQVTFAIVFELTAIGLHLASMEGTSPKVSSKKPATVSHARNPAISKPTLVPKVGDTVKKPPSGVSKDKEAYLSEVYKGDGLVSPGYKKIGKIIGVTDAKAKVLHKELQAEGVLKVENGITVIVKRKGVS
jgi:hypothetical protein